MLIGGLDQPFDVGDRPCRHACRRAVCRAPGPGRSFGCRLLHGWLRATAHRANRGVDAPIGVDDAAIEDAVEEIVIGVIPVARSVTAGPERPIEDVGIGVWPEQRAVPADEAGIAVVTPGPARRTTPKSGPIGVVAGGKTRAWKPVARWRTSAALRGARRGFPGAYRARDSARLARRSRCSTTLARLTRRSRCSTALRDDRRGVRLRAFVRPNGFPRGLRDARPNRETSPAPHDEALSAR